MTNALGRVTLVTGKEEFLGEREVAAVRAAVRAHDGEAEVSETLAGDLTLATLGELAAPSLFSSVRCVVVRGLEDLPDASVDGLLAYAAEPADDVALVLVHGGGPRGSGVLTKLRKLATVTEAKPPEVKPWAMAGFVADEVRSHGGRIDKSAAQALVAAVGADLRGLAAAADQLSHDTDGRPITEEVVKRYFGGRAEGKAYAIADAALSGRRQSALEELRWALTTGMAPTYVTGAISGSMRSLAAYVAAQESDDIRRPNLPDWKLKEIRAQAQGWTGANVARAVRAVAQADADIKGAASDASYTLERLVLTLAGLRGR
jgi:DNA polymerase III subunit delta